MIPIRLFLPLLLALFAAVLFVVSSGLRAQQPLPAEGDEAHLLEVLRSDGELFDKAKACQRLAIIGTADAVPVLASLLGDESLAHYARFGLESNPSPKVDEAFRQSLGELSGKPLVGVINSIGVRGDSAAVESLIELAKDQDRAVAAAHHDQVAVRLGGALDRLGQLRARGRDHLDVGVAAGECIDDLLLHRVRIALEQHAGPGVHDDDQLHGRYGRLIGFRAARRYGRVLVSENGATAAKGSDPPAATGNILDPPA